jgi:hypothetical protein
MKRWAILTVLLYALALLALTLPILMLAFSAWGNNRIKLQDELSIFKTWGYWLWLAIMIAGQALLLLLPINIAERRLPARRPLKIPLIVTAFFLANLFIAGVVSVLFAIFLDGASDIFELLSLSTLFHAQSVNSSNWGDLCGAIFTLIGFWIIWAVVFRNFAKSDAPDALLKRSTR